MEPGGVWLSAMQSRVTLCVGRMGPDRNETTHKKNIRRDYESCLIGVVNGNKIARISGRFFVGHTNTKSGSFLFQCAQVICFPTGHNVH